MTTGAPAMAGRADNVEGGSHPKIMGLRDQAKPGQIDMPESPFLSPETDQNLREDGDDELRAEDVRSVIGVSIGPEQTRLMSPTTPAAEKSAALDRTNSYGFFDDENQEDLEEVLRNTIENSVPPEPQHSDSDTEMLPGTPVEKSAPSTPKQQQQNFSLPSPWIAGPREFVQVRETKIQEDRATNRSRPGSSSILGDNTIKRFFSSLTFPTAPELRGNKDGPESHSQGEKQGQQRTTTRHGRSASLLNPRFPWSNPITRSSSGLGERLDSRDDFPGKAPRERASTFVARPQMKQGPGSFDGTRGAIGNVTQQADGKPRNPRTQSLKKSASDESLVRKGLSRTSTLESFNDWDHVNVQVNSRMKAIKDSLQDSLPSMPLINFQAFKTDFALRREGNIGSSAMSTVFGNAGTTTRSRQSSVGSSHSPQRLTRPRFPNLEAALEDLTGDIVVMGGYRGSILRSAAPPHRQLWVPVKVGLNIRKVNLEVGLYPEDEERMHETIIPSGMLSHIGPVDMSRRLLNKLKNCKNAKDGRLRVHDYGYDWRLSPHLLSRRLVEFLQGLECNQPGYPDREKGATIVAHSLGGLITRHAINQRPELCRGVLYAGVPQHCVNILGPFRNGDEVLLSSRVLTAQVNFTIRTSFLLLPDSGQCFIDRDTNERYDVDFFDPESWSRYAFSPCIAPCLPALGQPEKRSLFGSISETISTGLATHVALLGGGSSSGSNSNSNEKQENASSLPERKLATKADDILNPSEHTLNVQMHPPPAPGGPSSSSSIPLEEAKAYLGRTLAEVLAFRKELAFLAKHQAANAYPPLSLMYATSTPTVYGAKVAGRDGIARADAYDNLAFASGDGVVLARAAMAPRGYKVADRGRVRTDRGHVGMLGDLEAVGMCLLALQRARAEGVGLGFSEEGGEHEGKEGDVQVVLTEERVF